MQYPFQCSSLYDLENSESPVTYDPLASTSFLKDSICAHTDISYENGSYQKSLQPRSGKMLGPGPEISFQKDFMKEHFETIQKKTQNFMESVHKGKPKLFQRDQDAPLMSVQEFEDYLRRSSCNLTPSELQQFLVDLECENKLSQLVRFIASRFDSSLSSELISITHDVWDYYCKPEIRDEYKMDSPELKEFGANIARVFFVTRIGRKSKLFSQSDRAEADKCAIESYLTFFIVTVLFIIEEFAFNPFYIGASNLGRLLRRDHIYDSQCEEESDEELDSCSKAKKRTNL